MDDIQSWWEVPSIAHFCSLFRAAFNLLDFDIEELEEALLTDGAEDAGSSLLQELIVRLLCGCLANNDVSTFNYQMFLRRLFRQKYQECGRQNPFNTDMDFQFLPLRTKVEILHALCDFRLDAEDVQEVLKNLDSDSLRIMPLGYDENNSAYWYFYGTRLYKEEYKTIQKKKAKEKRRKGKEDKRKKKHNKSVTDSDSDDIGTGTWQVVCFTEHDWDKLTNVMRDSTSRVERSLYRTLSEDFLPEIPRLFAEKERLQRKRLLDYQPRRQSSRLEKLKQQKFEEQIVRDDEKLGPPLLQDESSKSSLVSISREGRAARALQRSRSRTGSECGSADSRGHSQSSNRSGSRPVGRQTNNSLASATGPIVIHGAQRKLRSSLVFRQTEEDLQTGMYKILKTIKTHEDAWPFVDPVEEEYAPRYYSIVNKPMDLQRMEDKLDEGEYLNFTDFKTDFQLIVDNCRKYNGTENEYTEMVGNLEEAFRVAADRYLESDPSSDEEVTVRFPPTPAESHAPPRREKHRPRPPKLKDDRASIPESTLSPESRSVTSPPPTDLDDKEKPGKGSEREDSSSRNSSRDRDRDLERERNREREPPARAAPRGQGPSKAKKRKVEVVKDADAIQALELATEQTLKDINKWLDDTPRFSEYSSASNSPSHTAAAIDDVDAPRAGKTDRRRPDRPPRTGTGNKDSSKRRPGKDASKQVPRREIQRTIERLQPGKSKGNLISNMQSLNAAKVKDEEGGVKPKECRKESIEPEDSAGLKLSLGTVLTSDVLGFDVGKASHSFTDTEASAVALKALEKPAKAEPVCDDEASQSSQEAPVTAPVKPEPDIKPAAKPKKPDDSSKPESKANHSAWFKAFGAPKPPAPAKPRRPEPEERRPVAAVRPMAQLPPEEPRMELRSPEGASPAPRSQEPASPHVTPRQRKASTGSSVSERSFLSQDLTDPLDNSCSPRLVLDERLGGYSSAHYPSPMHRSPMAASPVMASPRTDEPKHPSYPPPNGTIRVGFYQDTSSAFPKSSPDKPPPAPPPAYPTRAPDVGPGFVPYQPPPPYDPGPAYSPLLHYYDTSKPLTDQYQAARTQTTTPTAQTYANANAGAGQKGFVQKSAPPVIPVKKRMYTEVEANSNPPPQQHRYQPIHDDMSLNGMQPMMTSHVKPMTYDQPTSLPSQEKPMGLPPQYAYPGMEMQQPTAAHHQGGQTDANRAGSGQPGMNLGYRGPYQPAAPMGNLANLSHIVERYAGDERVLQMAPAFYGDKGMFAQPSTNMQGTMSAPMFQQAGSGTGPATGYSREPYQRADMSSMLGNKPIQPQYNRSVAESASSLEMQAMYGRQDLSSMGRQELSSMGRQDLTSMGRQDLTSMGRQDLSSMGRQDLSSMGRQDLTSMGRQELTSMGRQDLTSMLQNKTSGQTAYNRPVSDLSMLPNRSTPPVDPYAPSSDLTSLLSGKGSAPLPYNRPLPDYAMLPSKPADPPPAKPARKRKPKATAAPAPVEAAGFQHYAKPGEQPTALKTASVVPGSAFNFGPAPPGMGLYSEKDAYPNFLEDYRSAQSGYYVPEAGRDKSTQGSNPAFPFLSHPQPRAAPYPQLTQAFMNHHQPLMDSGSYPYFHRHPEELMRHSSNPMVLAHQGLLAPPTGYPPGYHPALGMRQPYDALNRPTWL